MKTIRPRNSDLKSLKLSPEEGFVLSRVDGPTSVKDLVALTGLEEGRIVEIVDNLATQGALDVEGHTSSARVVASAAPSSQSPIAAPSSPHASAAPALSEHDEIHDAAPDELEEVVDEEQPAAEAEAASDDDADVPPASPSEESLEEEPQDEAAKEREATDERNYRKIYETVFRPMEREARIAAAQTEDGANLYALCFDAEPQVINSLLGNPRFGLDHGRLVAAHHATHTGLELLGRRTEMIKDAGVQRKLLANVQLPGTLLRKIANPKLIMDVYKICINREFPERTRVMCREILCKKFTLGSPDERAALLIKTEGRCLVILVQVALDARTTQILVGKTTFTILFIQNLARWSATPPQLLAHLLKQPVVRQNIGLRKMILKHPNVPKDIKRNLSA